MKNRGRGQKIKSVMTSSKNDVINIVIYYRLDVAQTGSLRHPVRIKLTHNGLLVKLASMMQGAYGINFWIYFLPISLKFEYFLWRGLWIPSTQFEQSILQLSRIQTHAFWQANWEGISQISPNNH